MLKIYFQLKKKKNAVFVIIALGSNVNVDFCDLLSSHS